MYRNLFCLILINLFALFSITCSAETPAAKPSETSVEKSATAKETSHKKNAEDKSHNATTQKASVPKVPVMIGHYDDLDACLTFAMVSVKTLSVHHAPNPASKKVDTINKGQYVWMCDTKSPWVGIVYSKTDEACEVSSTIESGPEPYQGKCQSGWVEEKHLEALAG